MDPSSGISHSGQVFTCIAVDNSGCETDVYSNAHSLCEKYNTPIEKEQILQDLEHGFVLGCFSWVSQGNAWES